MDPRLTFWPDKAYPIDIIKGKSAYGYRCAISKSSVEEAATVGRAPLDHIQRSDQWRYLQADGSWKAQSTGAVASGLVCGSGHTVQWVPALKLYLNTYLPLLGGDVMYQVATDPAGHWSLPRRLATMPSGPPGPPPPPPGRTTRSLRTRLMPRTEGWCST